jgi:thiamine-phosphate pyrophosphorylase
MHKRLPKFFVFLDEYNNQIFKNNNTDIGIIYRNYNAKKRENELYKIAKACKKNRYQLFVSNDIKLAIKVKAEGFYIPSFNKNKSYKNLEKTKIMILGSAHNQKEITQKISQNCTAIFLSPVFFVEKSKQFLGLHKFNYLSQNNNINIFALGGISRNNIGKLKLLKTKGFGGIRLFKKKSAFFQRPIFIKNIFF